MKKITNFLKQERLLIILIVTAFILKLFFLSRWLDDWDSIQLALGVHEYSLVKHQPHPPGYPLYILIGKLLMPIFQTHTLTLTLMSAFFGTLTIVPLYLLAKKVFSKTFALLASLLFIFTPAIWLLSETALTDIVGLFFAVLTGYLFFKFVDDKKKTIWISFLAGLTIGVRFNEFPIVIGLLLWVMIKQRNLKYAFLQLLALGAGGLIWLLPMIFITGWKDFYETFTTNGAYVAEHDLLLGGDRSFLGLIKTKLLMIFSLSKLSFSLPFTAVFVVSTLWALTQKKLYKENWFQFSLVWLFSYCVLLVTFFNLELPRHIMPVIIPMILITTYTAKKLVDKNKLFWILPLILLAIIGQQGYSQVSRFHNSLPATIAPVLYVKQNFDPNNTVIYASYTLRNFQYYAPEFKSIDNKGDKSVITPEKTVIIDLPNLRDDPRLLGFEEVDTEYFKSDKDIFPKVDSIELRILKHKP